MIRRMLVLASCLLALTGCDEWFAKRPLIPVSQRADVQIGGIFDGENYNFMLKALGNGVYELTTFTNEIGDGSTEQVVFDEIGEPGEGYYLIETKKVDENGGYIYAYQIVQLVVDSDRPDQVVEFAQYSVNCSSRASALALPSEGIFDKCEFGSYENLSAAASDAMEWLSDARMRVYFENFQKLQ